MGLENERCKIVVAAKRSIHSECTMSGINDKIEKARKVLEFALAKQQDIIRRELNNGPS